MIRSYKEEQELKEKILELRKKNYPYDKIAMELGTNESRVKLIIGLLVEEGKLDSLATNLYKKETEEKLKQILSMAKAKRNVSEISSSLANAPVFVVTPKKPPINKTNIAISMASFNPFIGAITKSANFAALTPGIN